MSRIELSARERALLATLRQARTAASTTTPARAAIDWALAEWQHGRIGGPSLLVDRGWHDVDGRLAIVRIGLLERLSRMAPATAPPLLALHGIGDGTPGGWAAAVRVALANATAEERPHARPEPPRKLARAESLAGVLARFELDEQAYAPDLSRVVFPQQAGSLRLEAAPATDPGDAAGDGSGMRLAIGFRTRGVVPGPPRALTPQQRRAFEALIAALFALDGLALTRERDRVARRVLRRGLVTLALHDRAGGQLEVEQVVASLDRAAQRGSSARSVPSDGWRWPSAFALVTGALDRFAGPGREPLRQPVAVGTLVEVVDRPRGRVSGVGVVVAADALPNRGGAPLPALRARETVPVSLDGAVQRHPLAAVRTAPRAQLFGRAR